MKDKGPAEDADLSVEPVGESELPKAEQKIYYVVLNGKNRGVYTERAELEKMRLRQAPVGETPPYKYYRAFPDLGAAQHYLMTTSYMDEHSVLHRDPRKHNRAHYFQSSRYEKDTREGKTVIIMPQPNAEKRFDVVMSFEDNVLVMQQNIAFDALFAVIDEVMVTALNVIMGTDADGGWYAADDKVCFAIYDRGFIKKFHGGKPLTPDLSYFYRRAMDMSVRVLYMPEASRMVPQKEENKNKKN